MLFFILNMLYGLPHAALGPELTLDYHERSTLFSVREGFALVGTLVAAIVPGILTNGYGLRAPRVRGHGDRLRRC